MRGSAGSGTSAQRALYISVRSHMPFFTVSTARNGCSAVRNSSVAARIDGTESCRRGQVTRGWIALTYSHPANQPTYGVSVAADDAVVRPDDEGEPALVLQGPGVFAGGASRAASRGHQVTPTWRCRICVKGAGSLPLESRQKPPWAMCCLLWLSSVTTTDESTS